LIENRHGLIVDAMATQADGTAERDAAMLILDAHRRGAPWRRRTVGVDKGYDTRDFVAVTRKLGVTPHVTQNVTRPGGSVIDGRTTRMQAIRRVNTRAPASNRPSAGCRPSPGCGR
jgi:hypothetical protein